jgi:nitroimidazol reductase NimA-like FMN-containing flavoprotein (pyridoxamine 5'-phosphate oxidase superfamily)
MSRRDQIKMSDAEVASFLEEERTVTCATIGPRSWPHLMPLWYVSRKADALASSTGGSAQPGTAHGMAHPAGALDARPRIWAWTYASSQKVRNLERDPRATLQVEAGEQYQELRGVMFECDVVIHREIEIVSGLGEEIFRRYASPRGEPSVETLAPEVAAMVDKQAVKRVALEFAELRRASWDHRKLGGVY